jgi:hypothetical protein
VTALRANEREEGAMRRRLLWNGTILTPRPRATVLAVAVVVALGSGAATGAPADRTPPGEYATPSQEPDTGGSCHGRFELVAARCYRSCPRTHALLVDPRRDRGLCIARRATKVWYRVQLTATWHRRSPGRQAPDFRPEQTESHSWRFSSNGAVILYRQCTIADPGALSQGDARLLSGLDPAIDCARQGRALGLDLVEDVSFGARGTVVGGAYRYAETGYPATTMVWWDRGGGKHSGACRGRPEARETGTGPARWSATVATASQSAFAGGLSVSLELDATNESGKSVYVRTAVECPAAPELQTLGPPPQAEFPGQDLRAVGYGPFYRPQPAGPRGGERQERYLTDIRGRALVQQFTAELGARYDRPVITDRETVTYTAGDATETASFTLKLTRCPERRGRVSEGC